VCAPTSEWLLPLLSCNKQVLLLLRLFLSLGRVVVATIVIARVPSICIARVEVGHIASLLMLDSMLMMGDASRIGGLDNPTWCYHGWRLRGRPGFSARIAAIRMKSLAIFWAGGRWCYG